MTSNAFFDEIYMIKRKIDIFSRSEEHFLYSMAKTMKEKFDKYWGSGEDSSKKGNVLLYVAVVLDPRKKLDYLNYLNYSLSNLYGENVAKVITDLVESVLKCLYEHYNSTHSSYVSIQSASEISRMEGVGVDVDDDDDDQDRFIASQYKAFRQGKTTCWVCR